MDAEARKAALDAIDNALMAGGYVDRDPEVGGDAMRWAPDETEGPVQFELVPISSLIVGQTIVISAIGPLSLDTMMTILGLSGERTAENLHQFIELLDVEEGEDGDD